PLAQPKHASIAGRCARKTQQWRVNLGTRAAFKTAHPGIESPENTALSTHRGAASVMCQWRTCPEWAWGSAAPAALRARLQSRCRGPKLSAPRRWLAADTPDPGNPRGHQFFLPSDLSPIGRAVWVACSLVSGIFFPLSRSSARPGAILADC